MFYLPSSLNIPQISRLEGDCFLGLGYLGIIPCFLESFSFFVKYTSYVKPFVNSVVNFHVTLRPRFQQPANFVSSAFTSSCPVGRPPVYTSAFYVEWKVPEGWVMTRSPFVSPLSGTPYVLGVCTIVYLWTRWTGELIRARLLQTELQRRGVKSHTIRTHSRLTARGKGRLGLSRRARPTVLPAQPRENDALQGLPGDGGRSHAAGSSCGWTRCRLAKSTVLICIMVTVQVIFLSRKTERSPVSSRSRQPILAGEAKLSKQGAQGLPMTTWLPVWWLISQRSSGLSGCGWRPAL